jgi:hypothetical protein
MKDECRKIKKSKPGVPKNPVSVWPRSWGFPAGLQASPSGAGRLSHTIRVFRLP